MRTMVGKLLVSTVHMPNCPIRGPHYETMVFRFLDEGNRRTNDWHDLYVLFTNDEVVGHENGIAWAQSHTSQSCG